MGAVDRLVGFRLEKKWDLATVRAAWLRQFGRGPRVIDFAREDFPRFCASLADPDTVFVCHADTREADASIRKFSGDGSWLIFIGSESKAAVLPMKLPERVYAYDRPLVNRASHSTGDEPALERLLRWLSLKGVEGHRVAGEALAEATSSKAPPFLDTFTHRIRNGLWPQVENREWPRAAATAAELSSWSEAAGAELAPAQREHIRHALAEIARLIAREHPLVAVQVQELCLAYEAVDDGAGG